MFVLTGKEFDSLKSQFATSRWGERRKLPYVFTEYGALMLASALNFQFRCEPPRRCVKNPALNLLPTSRFNLILKQFVFYFNRSVLYPPVLLKRCVSVLTQRTLRCAAKREEKKLFFLMILDFNLINL